MFNTSNIGSSEPVPGTNHNNCYFHRLTWLLTVSILNNFFYLKSIMFRSRYSQKNKSMHFNNAVCYNISHRYRKGMKRAPYLFVFFFDTLVRDFYDIFLGRENLLISVEIVDTQTCIDSIFHQIRMFSGYFHRIFIPL